MFGWWVRVVVVFVLVLGLGVGSAGSRYGVACMAAWVVACFVVGL